MHLPRRTLQLRSSKVATSAVPHAGFGQRPVTATTPHSRRAPPRPEARSCSTRSGRCARGAPRVARHRAWRTLRDRTLRIRRPDWPATPRRESAGGLRAARDPRSEIPIPVSQRGIGHNNNGEAAEVRGGPALEYHAPARPLEQRPKHAPAGSRPPRRWRAAAMHAWATRSSLALPLEVDPLDEIGDLGGGQRP